MKQAELFQIIKRKLVIKNFNFCFLRAETIAKQLRTDLSTIGRSIFRKKLQSRLKLSTANNEEDFTNNGASGSTSNTVLSNFDFPLPAYERVALKKPAFYR